jgi:hypothetical protein
MLKRSGFFGHQDATDDFFRRHRLREARHAPGAVARSPSDAGDELHQFALLAGPGFPECIVKMGRHRGLREPQHVGHRLDVGDLEHGIEHSYLAGGELVEFGDGFERRRRVGRVLGAGLAVSSGGTDVYGLCAKGGLNVFRHGRARPGHPRLACCDAGKTWMPGTSPGMTNSSVRLLGWANH